MYVMFTGMFLLILDFFFPIFQIFIPIHKEIHWCLAVINKKDEKFQYLDSLRGRDKKVMTVLVCRVGLLVSFWITVIIEMHQVQSRFGQGLLLIVRKAKLFIAQPFLFSFLGCVFCHLYIQEEE